MNRAKIHRLTSTALALASMAILAGPAHSSAVDCQTGLPVAQTRFHFDASEYTGGQVFGKNTLSPDWLNAAGSISEQSYWTTQPTRYFVADNPAEFALASGTCSRDMEVDTWSRNGTVYLRLDPASGDGVYFQWTEETGPGALWIGVVRGADARGVAGQGAFYLLYSTDSLISAAPGYRRNPTDNDYFTFGVEGFEMYAKYNGVEFIRIKDHRVMRVGRAAVKAGETYGFRLLTLRHLDPKPVFSSYVANEFDLRDFGIRSIQTTGTIQRGQPILLLDVMPATPFKVGDPLIVETGHEAGLGQRGTLGVGGTWPQKRYADASSLQADRRQPDGTYAYVEDSGQVYQWLLADGVWHPQPEANYYTSRANPLALKARIIAIQGLILTLDTAAQTDADHASVYLDNAPALNRLWNLDPAYAAITPASAEFIFPPGSFAVGDRVWLGPHQAGTRIRGSGVDQSMIFSPQGVPSAMLHVTESNNIEVSHLTWQGNARDQGYGLNISETSIPQGTAYPSGILFESCQDSQAHDLVINDVFQKAVGSSYSTNVWGRRVRAVMTTGLRTYVQWIFGWANSSDGGCEDCSVESPTLLGGFEAFSSRHTQFVRPKGVNAVVAMNNAGSWLFKDGDLRIKTGANTGNSWFSVYTPMFDVNTNIANTLAPLGGTIDNIVMTQEGYINGPGDANQDSLAGIVINQNNPKVTVRGGTYSAPDLSALRLNHGALGLGSAGLETAVTDFRVIGKADNVYANINLFNGTVSDCIADAILPQSVDAHFTGCVPNSMPPSDISDLAATWLSTTTAELRWTAPGGWAKLRQASGYQLLLSTSPLTDPGVVPKVILEGLPRPAKYGIEQAFELADLSSQTTYYAAMISINDRGITSKTSNVAILGGTATLVEPPPSFVYDLPAPNLSGISGKVFRFEDEIQLNYEAPYSSFNWELSRLSDAELLAHASGSDIAGVAILRIATTAPRFALKTLEGVPGLYELRVQAVNGAAQTSPWARASFVMAASALMNARVYPNPLKASRGETRVTFDQLPAGSAVNIFTISGRLVKSMDAPTGLVRWDLRNDDGEQAASGMYLYLIKDRQGNSFRGQLALIR